MMLLNMTAMPFVNGGAEMNEIIMITTMTATMFKRIGDDDDNDVDDGVGDDDKDDDNNDRKDL